MNADVLTTRVADGIAVIKLGSPKRIYFDAEMGDVLTETLDRFAGDANVRVVVVTGGAPGYFNRHFHIPALIEIAESLRASGRQWPENATYNGGFFGKALDRAMEIAKRLSSHTPESVAYIKRLVRNATETPLAQGLALERNLFLKLCISEAGLARMRSYEEKKITSPSRSFEVGGSEP